MKPLTDSTLNPDTLQVILWMQKLCRLYSEVLRDRCQETITMLFSENRSDDLEELGETIWDDFTSHDRIIKPFPPPAIDIHLVKWSKVAEYMVQVLKLELYEFEFD